MLRWPLVPWYVDEQICMHGLRAQHPDTQPRSLIPIADLWTSLQTQDVNQMRFRPGHIATSATSSASDPATNFT
jgi:hypothetical protein